MFIYEIVSAGLVHDLAKQVQAASQVERGALDAGQLAGDGGRGVDRGHLRAEDLERVVQGVAGLVALQVPVGVVGQAQDCRPVRRALVSEVQLVASDLVGHEQLDLARVALVAVRRHQPQGHGRVRGADHFEGPAPEALVAAVEVVGAIVRL